MLVSIKRMDVLDYVFVLVFVRNWWKVKADVVYVAVSISAKL